LQTRPKLVAELQEQPLGKNNALLVIGFAFPLAR
jgi:hypothetical protein